MNTPIRATTLPGLLLTRSNETPHEIAMTFHDLGIWNPLSWSQLGNRVAQAANALAQSGVGRSEVVALISENRPDWIVADLAIQAIGAVSLPLRPDFSPERVQSLCLENNARHFVVGDQQQFDKVVPILQPDTLVLIVDPRGVSVEEMRSTRTVVWEKALASAPANGLEHRVNELRADTICTHTISLEKSALGEPEIEVTQQSATSLLSAAVSLTTSLDIHAGDQLYPFANLADPTERSLCEVLGLFLGSTVNLGEGGLLTTLESRAVQPTIAHVPSDVLNRMHADILDKQAKHGIRRFAVNRVMSGARHPQSRAALPDVVTTHSLVAAWVVASLVVHSALRSVHGGVRLGIIAALGVAVLGVLVLGGFGVRPFLRKAYGLGRARALLTGSGLQPETVKLLEGLKLSPIRESSTQISETENLP
jgi:long-chain acyl-CoA synthetase